MAYYGKLNFSTSFKPTSAFPLDARTYFEGDDAYARAEAAATSAAEPGSTTTLYYYGMKLLVNQGGVYTWYKISEDNTLVEENSGGGGSESDLPPCTESDNGKFLRIEEGEPKWVAIPNAEEASF